MIKKKHALFKENQKQRWCFRRIEIYREVTSCLLESKFPCFSLSLYPACSIKEICLLTGNSKKVYSFFKISRHSLRKASGFICGFQKSLW